MEKSVSNTCVTHMELWVRFPMLADKDRNYPVPSVGAAAIRGFYQKHLLIRTQPEAFCRSPDSFLAHSSLTFMQLPPL